MILHTKKVNINNQKYLNGILLFIILISACNKNGEFIVGGHENINIGVIDTSTIEVSTYLLSPLPTAGTGNLLLGKIKDPEMGNLELVPYFRFRRSPEISGIPNDARFESLSIVLPYNKYHYGDTSKVQEIKIYRLKESIQLDKIPPTLENDERPVFVNGEETIFSNKVFEHEINSVGEISLQPKPNSIDEKLITIPLANELGESFLKKIKNKDQIIKDDKAFLEYMKGFVLQSSFDGSILGFKADSTVMKLTYSIINEEDGQYQKKTINFNLEKEYHFNHINTNRSGTILESLTQLNKEVPAKETQHRVFLQGGTGVVARIRFPYIQDLVNEKALMINKAELIIETVPLSSESVFKLPVSLNLMKANRFITPIAVVKNSYSDSTQFAYLKKNLEGNLNHQYVFNLTQYISEFRGKQGNSQESLLLSVPLNRLTNTTDRMIIAANKNLTAIKLRIYYTKF